MNAATAGFYDFENHTNRGGLPGTIRAKKTIDRSFWNRETYIIHGGEITIGFRDIVQAKNRARLWLRLGLGMKRCGRIDHQLRLVKRFELVCQKRPEDGKFAA
jgi:hypothetical protein